MLTSKLGVVGGLNVGRLCSDESSLASKEAISTKLRFYILLQDVALRLLCLLLQDGGPVDKMAALEVKDRIHRTDAILTNVGILVDDALLFLAQRIDHLADTMRSLWHHYTLSDVSLLVLTREYLFAALWSHLSRVSGSDWCSIRNFMLGISFRFDSLRVLR